VASLLATECTHPERQAQTNVRSVDVARAIDRGLSYLRSDRSDPSALVVLDYLQRKYALGSDLSYENMAHGHGEALGTWARFVGGDPPVNEDMLGSLQGRPGTETFVNHALYCDRFPLPSDFGVLLRRYVMDGAYEGYEQTHASLTLKLIRDNGCRLGMDEADLRGIVWRGLLDVLDGDGEAPLSQAARRDVRYEALAFLQDFAGNRDVEEARFSNVLSEQRADGGWGPEVDRPSKPHPTVLAVWALLAHAHSNTPEVPFARR
jgi:hypothetical protein